MKKTTSFLLISALCLTILTSCQKEVPKEEKKPEKEKPKISFQEVEAGTFAKWEEDKVSYIPSVPAYSVNIPKIEDGPSTGNVTIYENQYLTDDIIETLNKYGFAIKEDNYSEFFDLYESNRYDLIANFITTDSVLHTYHLFFNHLLKSLEENQLIDVAEKISDQMVKISEEQYQTLKGTDYENAAMKNIAYFSVAKKILEPESEIPSLVEDKVKNELELLKKHEGIKLSPIFEYKEDYSQYSPRGHYTKSEALKKYFNALMWYGRITFRLKEDEGEEETKSALLVVSAIKNNPEIFDLWEKLYEPINFFVGEPDDLSYYEYLTVAKNIYGGDFSAETFTKSAEKLSDFMQQARKLPDPKINSMPVFAPDYIENERTEEIKGFRFLGQRSTVDAMIFQKLIYRDVKKHAEDGSYRMLPMALDIPATMGFDEAYEIMENLGETKYKNYKENMAELKDFLAEMPQENWTKNLYWGWMNTLKTLIKDYGEGYPFFMQNEQWKLKELVTFLASWTELKHDTILYAKQVYAELGGGYVPEEIDDRGYVEPNPELYNKMKSLINLTVDGLEQRELLSAKNKDLLTKLADLVEKLRDISIKELENKPLTEDDYEFIKTYGGSLEHFWYETLTEEEKKMDQQSFLNTHPAAIIADVATDPNGVVLEEGTGDINKIYVVFPIDGELHIATGGVFSHYEFKWPMSDRLTDEKWRAILFPHAYPETQLETEFEPEIAEWQKEFTVTY
ncbi:DUF3160 domain-containing protein [Candidatus Peregrinibacteria bacterium]|nr:DUF3160 domain-containing protein [Candidatus Peregrinibacteria bacterium]